MSIDSEVKNYMMEKDHFLQWFDCEYKVWRNHHMPFANQSLSDCIEHMKFSIRYDRLYRIVDSHTLIPVSYWRNLVQLTPISDVVVVNDMAFTVR